MEPITVGGVLDLKKDNVILNKLGELDAFKKPVKPKLQEETKETVKLKLQEETGKLKLQEETKEPIKIEAPNPFLTPNIRKIEPNPFNLKKIEAPGEDAKEAPSPKAVKQIDKIK